MPILSGHTSTGGPAECSDDDYFYPGGTISANNISSDSTSPDGASWQNKTATFVDADNRDYHLAGQAFRPFWEKKLKLE